MGPLILLIFGLQASHVPEGGGGVMRWELHKTSDLGGGNLGLQGFTSPDHAHKPRLCHPGDSLARPAIERWVVTDRMGGPFSLGHQQGGSNTCAHTRVSGRDSALVIISRIVQLKTQTEVAFISAHVYALCFMD